MRWDTGFHRLISKYCIQQKISIIRFSFEGKQMSPDMLNNAVCNWVKMKGNLSITTYSVGHFVTYNLFKTKLQITTSCWNLMDVNKRKYNSRELQQLPSSGNFHCSVCPAVKLDEALAKGRINQQNFVELRNLVFCLNKKSCHYYFDCSQS